MNSNLGPQFLYHGTTSEHADSIDRGGLRSGSYATHDPSVAQDWARIKARGGMFGSAPKGEPVVYSFPKEDADYRHDGFGSHVLNAEVAPDKLRRM